MGTFEKKLFDLVAEKVTKSYKVKPGNPAGLYDEIVIKMEELAQVVFKEFGPKIGL